MAHTLPACRCTGFSLQALPDEWDILLIDDFQLLQEQETSQTLCELIRANPARRFVFLSRGCRRRT